MSEILKDLSERATQGEWSLGSEALMVAIMAPRKCISTHVLQGTDDPWLNNAAFIVALVTEYRGGRLYTSEDLACAEAAAHAKGRAEGVGEAVKIAEDDEAWALFWIGQPIKYAIAAAIRALLPTTGGSDA